MANQTIEITVEEYKKFVADNIMLNTLKNYAAKEEVLMDYRIREIIGVPRPESKEE